MVFPELAEEALPAWQAYNAMEATKLRHFDLLTTLEDKYQDQGSASEAEQTLLSRLLADHDQQVRSFKQSISRLRDTDPAAHASLIGYISALNSALAPFQHTQASPKAN